MDEIKDEKYYEQKVSRLEYTLAMSNSVTQKASLTEKLIAAKQELLKLKLGTKTVETKNVDCVDAPCIADKKPNSGNATSRINSITPNTFRLNF